MFGTPLKRLRLLGYIEALSFLLLLGVAMPLKYLVGIPEAVQIAGWIHGLLFIALCAVLAQVTWLERWPLSRSALVFVAALLPLGPFFIREKLAEPAETP